LEVNIISEILKLVSPIPVSVNHYLKPRPFITYVNGKPKAMVTMYETADAKKYKKEFIKYIKEQVKLQGFETKLEKFKNTIVDCVFYFPRIDMDANNTWKLLLDSITESGVVWLDDNTTLEGARRIFYDPKNPRLELTISYADYIGIFDNQEQLDGFINNNCIQCKRFNKNCSILNSAKEGRIQEEIQDFKCSKFKSIK
jgi:Holliday junction resolvase RusA-like endonuclease